MKVAVGKTAVGEQTVASNRDGCGATEARSTHSRVRANVDHRIGAVCPWGDIAPDLDVVTEAHESRPPDKQSAADLQATAGSKSVSRERKEPAAPLAAQAPNGVRYGISRVFCRAPESARI